jgi:hypothetical protein
MFPIVLIFHLFLIILSIIAMRYGEFYYPVLNIFLIILHNEDIRTIIKNIFDVVKDLAILNIELICWLGIIGLIYYTIRDCNSNINIII